MASATSSTHASAGDSTESPAVLRVEGLRTYFHTYEGVVKAVEGIDLVVRAGETVGLVGETGSGKSVTALSILRLVPTPPGKIEAGRVFVNEPPEVHELRREYEAIAFERLRKRGKESFTSSAEVKELLGPEIEDLRMQVVNATSETKKAQANRRLAAATSAYDVLMKSEEEVREIRGNAVAMIFQEPMTALNPVFTVGTQIAETLILHKKDDLIRGVLQTIDRQLQARGKRRRARRLSAQEAREQVSHGRSPENLPRSERAGFDALQSMRPDQEVCSACLAPAGSIWAWCPSCGTRLEFDLLSPLRSRLMRLERRLYERMLANPADELVDFLDSVRIVRRLVRSRLWDEGVRLAVERLSDVKISEPERIAGQYPFELSGGMRQRAMIAMMMACSPNLLIADEPTTALDVTVEAQILKLMKELQTRTNMAILLITHDLGVVAEVCDRVGVMYAGNVVEFGTADEIFHRTLHPYTDGLMRSIPRFLGQVAADRKRELYIIRGTVPNLLHPPSGCRFHPRCPRALDICATVVPPLEPMEGGHLAACHNPIPRGGTPG